MLTRRRRTLLPPPLLLLIMLLLALRIRPTNGEYLTVEDVVAKEQEWAKRALERRGHVLAGTEYLEDLLNMDHHLLPPPEPQELFLQQELQQDLLDDKQEQKENADDDQVTLSRLVQSARGLRGQRPQEAVVAKGGATDLGDPTHKETKTKDTDGAAASNWFSSSSSSLRRRSNN